MESVRDYTRAGVKKAIMIGLIAVMATVFGVSPSTAQTKYTGEGTKDKPFTNIDPEVVEGTKEKPRAPLAPRTPPLFERNIKLYGNPWEGDSKTWKNPAEFSEAVKSLRKLGAKIEVGITYKDYVVTLGDIKFAVDGFLASSDAKNKPALSSAIKYSLKCYMDAKELWKLKIEGTELNQAFRNLGIYDKSDDFLRTGGKHIDDIWRVLVRDYPDFAALSTAGESRLDYHGDRYYIVKIDDLTHLLWSKAASTIPRIAD
jgi:hypothetical protein